MSEELMSDIESRENPEDAAKGRAATEERRRLIEKASQQKKSEKHERAARLEEEGGLESVEIEVGELPGGWSYPDGTTIHIRPPGLREIVSFSHVNEESVKDIRAKMDMLLERCCYVKLADGTTKSHYYIREADRVYLVLALRELTFPKGQYYTVKATCSCDKKSSVEVPLLRQHLELTELDQELAEFVTGGAIRMVSKHGEERVFGLPSIGAQTSLVNLFSGLKPEKRSDEFVREVFRLGPYLMHEAESITGEQVEQMVDIFEQMDAETYCFVSEVVSKIAAGIKNVKFACGACGASEVAPVRFRDGLKGLFALRGGFRAYIGEPVPSAVQG